MATDEKGEITNRKDDMGGGARRGGFWERKGGGGNGKPKNLEKSRTGVKWKARKGAPEERTQENENDREDSGR